MRIVLSVAGHLKTAPMNRYVHHTLLSAGHEVILHNCGPSNPGQLLLKRRSKERLVAYKNQRLIRLAKHFRPDLFFSVFGFDHDRACVDEIRSLGIQTVCWWLNDPFQIERSLANASAYHFYFTNAKCAVETYHERGATNVSYLPLGCYPRVHRKLPSCNSRYDVCFAGDWNPAREAILSSLAEDFDISIFGPWGRKVARDSILRKRIVKNGFFSPEEMVRIFNHSKTVLNVHSWFGRWDYGTNPRLFEAGGCGAFQVCDWKQEIPDLYAEGNEIVLYHSIGELKEELTHFLSRDAERIAIADRAYARTHAEHTYQLRLEELFSRCGLS